MITPKYLTITMLAAFMLIACNHQSRQEITYAQDADSKPENAANPLIGSWVQPNPINENEMQGFTLKNDGTAESINMATLIYQKWWAEDGKLTLIAESVGNGTSFIDTTEYVIVKNTDAVLELKKGSYTARFTKKKTQK